MSAVSLNDRIVSDRSRVFLNLKHFATVHRLNGTPFTCVIDEDEALKRKNNNVNDISWDNNTIDTLLYVREEDWPGRKPPVPNEFVYFDNVHMKVLTVSHNMGIMEILLTTNSPKQATD